MHKVPLGEFTMTVEHLGRHGHGLKRPENVLCFRDGTIFASSDAGFISRIEPDGRQREIGSAAGRAPTTMLLESEDSLIVNDTTDGMLHRLRFDGTYETYLDEVDGEPIGSANYVFRDNRDRIWIAVASRRKPPHESIAIVPDGYIAVVEDGKARMVADGIRWPNEVRLDRDERHAYVSETFGGRVLRYEVTADGLGEAEVFGPDPLGDDVVPDGIALDAEGNLWVAIVSRNGLMVIEPDGSAHTVFEQPVASALADLRAELRTDRIARDALCACAGPDLKLLTSVGFVGPELRTMVMGSLAMDRLVKLDAPVAGLPLFHQRRASAPPHVLA
jgi:sugar lactone lactonase YvrE